MNESAYGNDKQTNAQILKEKLLAMQGKVDGLLKVEVGFDFSNEKDSCDVVLYSEFTSKGALHQYQIHPDHEEIKNGLAKCDMNAELWIMKCKQQKIISK
ncbi:MAG: Dabb family protein [Ignavibacteriales bacterium]|nr:Dabb family protein [Ignavibacteriales bacterium]